MSQVEVQIMGQGYLLASPDGGEQDLLKAAHRVDEAMCKIRDGGKVKARDRIAVLAALNLAFEQPASPAVSPSAATPSSSNLGDSSSNEQINQLIARLDSALGHDGQLL
jgi:cell division protein ZapA